MATLKSIKKRLRESQVELFWYDKYKVVLYTGSIESLNENSRGFNVKLAGCDKQIPIEELFININEACNSWITAYKHRKKNENVVTPAKIKEAFENFKF